MTLLRNILSDLVEKRLWPVAAVLVLALVAVPVVLGRDGGDQDAPPLPPPAAPEGVEPAVTAGEMTGDQDRSYPKNDPFRPRTTPKAETADDTGAIVDAGDGAVAGAMTGGAPADGGAAALPLDIGLDGSPIGGGSNSSGAPASPSGTPSTDKGTGKADEPVATDDTDAWRVDLRFGQDGNLKAMNDVIRLTPLPDPANPFFIFLGVQADGKTALFLVSSDATASGDGTCRPTPETCERVEMRAGDTESFQVVTPEGQTVRYDLELVRVVREKKASPAKAAAARARESAAGRRVLRRAVDTGQVEVSDLAYSKELGLVVPSGVDQERDGALFGGYRVDLRFGAPGQLVKRYNLARLTPLPSVAEPSFVFLGVLGDGETAIFLNPTEALAAGDAVCEPSPQQCQRVTLQEGQSATFAAPTINGATTDYQLDIDAITPLEASTPEQARALRHRESPRGRVILRRLVNEVGGLVANLTFAGGKGVVEKAAPAAE